MNALMKIRSNGSTESNVTGSIDRILSLVEIRNFNSEFSKSIGSTYERVFFGMPLTRAVELGYQLTARGYFDATESIVAEHTARTLRRIVSAYPFETGPSLKLLDLFAGSGQMSWAFIRAGFDVESTEVDSTRALVAAHNLKKSSLVDHWKLFAVDAVSFLNSKITSNAQFDAVYLDPPWAGNYDYNLSKPFKLEDMAPNGELLLEKALQIADAVALKCPQNICRIQLEDFCKRFDLWGKFEAQDLAGLPAELNQATVYFLKRGKYPHLLDEGILLSRGMV